MYREDIYVFVLNTKFISSNVLKMSVISRKRSTSEIADIFNILDEMFLVLTEKSKFSFYFFCLAQMMENNTVKNDFFTSHLSSIVLHSPRL